MATLSQSQIDALKNQGLSDEKIKALALHRGYDLPQQSTLGAIGSALIKSERGFGQSIAGAVGGAFPKLAGGDKIAEANRLAEQVKANVLNTIKDKRARGEDTTRLIKALQTMDKEVNFYDILNTSTGGSLDKSARQVFGEGFGVAADIIGAGALPGGIGQAAKATSLGRGILTGAKAGAVGGGIFGVAQGAARAAQENKSAGEIVGGGIGGGIIGGVAGGVIGGTIGGISGWLAGRAQRLSQKEQDFVLDLVSPKATTKVKEAALAEGRVSEQGLFTGSKILPSKRDMELADAVKGVVSSRNSAVQNIRNLENTVDEINSGVKAYVSVHKVPFNTNQLRTQLNAGQDELRLVFASDTTAKRTYKALVDEFIKHVQSKDTAGLFDARQAVDSIPAVRKLLESQAFGENVKKEVVLTVRRQANTYIASLLPKGNVFRETLLRENKMLEALGNIAQKSAKEIGVSKLLELTTKYPILKAIIGGLAGGIGLGAVGVGASVLRSTD